MSMLDQKLSITGWCSKEHEVQRFETLCKVQVGTKTYLYSWGLDWDTWLNPNMNFSTGSLSSYTIQQATQYAIGVLDLRSYVDQSHRLNMSAMVQGVKPMASSISKTYFNL